MQQQAALIEPLLKPRTALTLIAYVTVGVLWQVGDLTQQVSASTEQLHQPQMELATLQTKHDTHTALSNELDNETMPAAACFTLYEALIR